MFMGPNILRMKTKIPSLNPRKLNKCTNMVPEPQRPFLLKRRMLMRKWTLEPSKHLCLEQTQRMFLMSEPQILL